MKILIAILIAISLYGSEETALQMIKEQNGIALTEEQIYFNEMKNNLLNTFKLYNEKNILNKKNIEYIKTEKKINELKTIENLFSKEITETKFQIKTIKGEFTEYNLGDIIFQASLKNKEYFKKVLDNNLIRLNINEKLITKDIHRMFLNYMNKNIDNFTNEKNVFLNLELVINNEVENLAIELYRKFDIDQKNYLYFIINEKELKSKMNITQVFLFKLKKDIEEKRIIEEDYILLNPKELGKIKNYNKPYYSVVKFKIKTSLVSYLLTASNSTFFFKKQNEFFNNTELTQDVIKERFKELYGMNDLNVSNIEELIAIYGNGTLIKIMDKKAFINKFKEQI